MRYVYSLNVLSAILAPAMLLAGPGFVTPAEVTVGRNLQMYTNIRLTEHAPETGLMVTITSDDPSRLLLSALPDKPGAKAITIKVNANYFETPDFMAQAFSDNGSVTYTISAPGYESSKGTIKLAQSSLLLVGPFKAPSFSTTPNTSAKMTVYSALIDAEGKFVMQQSISAGAGDERSAVKVSILSSDPKVGIIPESVLTMAPGDSSMFAEFRPNGNVGTTSLTVKMPAGFSQSKQYAVVKAMVELPGMGLTGDINLGKDLQVPSFILLGEAAPAKGLDVTLTSSDPKAMVLSASVDKLGSGSVTIHVPAGEMRIPYFIQGLADSGTINHTASAPGYRDRVAPVYMAPSGIMVVYSPYGPPDEAEFLRAKATRDPRAFTVSLKEPSKTHLTLWTVYLDPKTRRGADITAQRLRPGVVATVNLSSTDPTIAKIESKVTLTGPSEWAMTEFVPLRAGQTTISVDTPAGFTTPSNAITVTATVKN